MVMNAQGMLLIYLSISIQIRWVFGSLTAHQLTRVTWLMTSMSTTWISAWEESKSTYMTPSSHSTILLPNLATLIHEVGPRPWPILLITPTLNYAANQRAWRPYVLQELKSVWDKLASRCKGKAPVRKCSACTKSQVKKDTERQVAQAEAMGAEDTVTDANHTQAESKMIFVDRWCCISWVLLCQEDFVNEKPLLQHYLEDWGHVCMFLLKFHCEFNLIKMLWGYAKYHMYFTLPD